MHLSKTIPDGEYTHDFFEITIGYFSSREKAQQAIEHYKKLPGFKNQSTVHQASPIEFFIL